MIEQPSNGKWHRAYENCIGFYLKYHRFNEICQCIYGKFMVFDRISIFLWKLCLF